MILECHNVTKLFGALAAVEDVSFSVEEGEVLGIMGPNGAGKSTLMNLIMGVYPMSQGEIRFDEQTISGMDTSAISKMGIGRTYQIPQPFTSMTVLENLLVGEMYGHGQRSMGSAKADAIALLERVSLSQFADVPASRLGLLNLKRLELARALSLKPRLLLLDEIFGGLVDSEIETLQQLITALKAERQTMLIIEHVLGVLFNQADRIIVLNFGRKIADDTPEKISEDKRVIEVYLGEERGKFTPKPPQEHSTKSPLLSVSGISAAYGGFQALFDLSLDIYPGEIVALIGVNGSGKTTLIRAITRQLSLLSGDITYKGQSIRKKAMHEISGLGIAQAIEGRKIFPQMTVRENLEMGAYPPRSRNKRHETIERIFELFPRLLEREHQLGQTLSGGEQQMLALGRALMALPELLILDEVSLGLAPLIIDDLYEAIRDINDGGTTILLVEQSVHRSLEIANRAYIIEHGRIALSGTAFELANDPEVQRAYFGLEESQKQV
jgi:branched-chain amino acid transport system ATP-binding protein